MTHDTVEVGAISSQDFAIRAADGGQLDPDETFVGEGNGLRSVGDESGGSPIEYNRFHGKSAFRSSFAVGFR
jgi:hypothetical protein